ncbi:zinc finger BED domain-containing protein RICESLEEPER 2-like protein [Tanacetum coccineum]|uniref:Zinc finger BED domain-containing protein RICESLEEPER 2-like protein n=1 Tax=Tanacetum coccineum TaxID=301880 RepID=A0ABQ5BPA4_9ASTR
MKESFKQMLKDVFKSGDKIRKRYMRICRDADKPCYSPNWDVDTRWNSTFEMFESGLKQKTTLAYFHDILVNKNGRRFKKFPVEYWVMIETLNPLLEVFQNATVILSGVYYPTSPLDIHKRHRDCSYQCPPSMSISKADFVSHLHPKDFDTFEVGGFGKQRKSFPVLSRMAMDILSVQASSVAYESAFSTSEGVFNVEVATNEATQLTDQEIALDASSDGSSGEPRHDYMMSSGAEDDQTGDGHDGSMSHGYY